MLQTTPSWLRTVFLSRRMKSFIDFQSGRWYYLGNYFSCSNKKNKERKNDFPPATQTERAGIPKSQIKKMSEWKQESWEPLSRPCPVLTTHTEVHTTGSYYGEIFCLNEISKKNVMASLCTNHVAKSQLPGKVPNTNHPMPLLPNEACSS